MLGETHRVVGADLEGDHRADVAEDGVRGLVVELRQILVGDDQGEAVLAGFAEGAGEAAGGEVLELVDVKAEVAAVGLWDVGTGHRSLLDAGDEQGSEQSRVVLAQAARAEIDDQDLAVVHDTPQVERPTGLADDVADRGVGQERADFVLNRGDGLGAIVVGPRRELMHPERPHDRVADS